VNQWNCENPRRAGTRRGKKLNHHEKPLSIIISGNEAECKEEFMKKTTLQTPTDAEILSYNSVPVDVAAKYIGWSPCNVVFALQQERAPFGIAARTGCAWTYNISPGLLVKYKRGELQAWRLNEFLKLLRSETRLAADEYMQRFAGEAV